MKKRLVCVLMLICVLTLLGCNRKSMNDIIENEPNITGFVKETAEHSVLIENETGEYWVSLQVENKDSITNFTVGDEIVVYFDGNIAETYPMQINTVYAITLKTPAETVVKLECPVEITADGETIQPYLHFAYSAEWTENGFLAADGVDPEAAVPELAEKGVLPQLDYTEDFRVDLADNAEMSTWLLLFDSQCNRLQDLESVSGLSALDTGEYYVGFLVNVEGEYIAEAGENEYTGWLCLFQMTVSK